MEDQAVEMFPKTAKTSFQIMTPSPLRPLKQDRFKDRESSGVEIVLVLSQPHGGWTGQSGYMCSTELMLSVVIHFQAAFLEPSKFIILSPQLLSFCFNHSQLFPNFPSLFDCNLLFLDIQMQKLHWNCPGMPSENSFYNYCLL
ncbi:fruit protein pKIWI502-like [Pyrus ussuriensis x Pyrus communis]|uniref:Fruit protein pKIWI502-like n=1 Tax=Pyrus ussuriensis x Pyrus communis TaxID=2448454 RepID=A0A5N5G5Y2_9ROSA|nr:fruit protein pKIWI502-like [Pyrus ussuriensis x Pyrus communis]KAB2623839.1 fruit protein pKIWI502-like [Pyrus ussuriensis x Pyrus communis]